MDMEAGVEHIGRATSGAVDRLIVMVYPGRRSQVAATRIRKLAGDIGVKNISVVVNRVRNDEDREQARKNLADFDILGMVPVDDILGMVPVDDNIAAVDHEARRPYDRLEEAPAELGQMVDRLLADADG